MCGSWINSSAWEGGADVCAREVETLVVGLMQQQERASQGVKVSEWADIKGSLGVHLLRLERRSVDSKGGNALAGWGASGWCLVVSQFPQTFWGVGLCVHVSNHSPARRRRFPLMSSLKSLGCFPSGWVSWMMSALAVLCHGIRIGITRHTCQCCGG